MVESSIEVDGISLEYHGFKVRGLQTPTQDVLSSFERNPIENKKGETAAVMGHNGAGKSTLLRVMAGLLRPKSGKVEIVGNPRSCLASIQAENSFSARQNISWLARAYGANPDITVSSVEEFSDIGEAFDRPISTLSTGMKGRVDSASLRH